MTRYLLDTNIISNVTQPNPSPSLLEWMSEQADTDLFISALTVAEIQRGLLQKPAGNAPPVLNLFLGSVCTAGPVREPRARLLR